MPKRKKIAKKRKQRGGRMAKTAQGVYSALKLAADTARHSKPSSIFRRSAINRFGIPPMYQRKMYKYH